MQDRRGLVLGVGASNLPSGPISELFGLSSGCRRLGLSTPLLERCEASRIEVEQASWRAAETGHHAAGQAPLGVIRNPLVTARPGVQNLPVSVRQCVAQKTIQGEPPLMPASPKPAMFAIGPIHHPSCDDGSNFFISPARLPRGISTRLVGLALVIVSELFGSASSRRHGLDFSDNLVYTQSHFAQPL